MAAQETITPLEATSIRMQLSADPVSPQYSMSLFSGQYAELNNIYWRIKRPLGLLIVLSFGISILPIAWIITLILATQDGPILIKSKRLGLHGKRFTIYRFRTLPPTRFGSYATLQPQGSHYPDRFGQFLLDKRLDRIPMIWNVLRGDMSIVGPYAMSVEEVIGGGRFARHTLAVRPGVTGLWWLAGQSDLRRRLALDRSYVERASPLMDLTICWRTLRLIHGRVKKSATNQNDRHG